MELGIEGRVAIVGGASQGIGKACGLGLAQEGASLAICARTRETLQQAASEIRKATGAQVLTIEGDLSRLDTVKRLVQETLHHFGRVDILLNNVGGPPAGDAETTSEEAWQVGVDQALLFYVRMCREAIPIMKKQNWGRILNILSVSVKQPIANLVLSNALRMGVVGYMKTLADEVGRYNITVNNLCPGTILTDRLRHLSANWARERGIGTEEMLNQQAQQNPMRRLGRPEEVATLAVFLASEKASYITGATVPVDGGALRPMY